MDKQSNLPSVVLLIERDEDNYTPISRIPEEYLRLLLPYFGAYFYQDDNCDMLCQHIRVKDFSIWGHDILAKKDMLLQPRTPRHILALHYMNEDTIDAMIDNMGPFKLTAKQVNLFSLHSDFHSAEMKNGDKIFSFHINIRPEALPKLADKYPLLQYLTGFDLDNMNGPVNTALHEINTVCYKILKNIFTCKYVELQASCYLYRCCINLYENFAVQNARAQLAQDNSRLPNAAQMNEVLKFVENNAHRALTVKELATWANMPEDLLGSDFERTYAVSLPDFIRQQRMTHLYELMLRTNGSLSYLAWKTGYKNRHAMVTAFEEYFEHDPIRIRNAQ